MNDQQAEKKDAGGDLERDKSYRDSHQSQTAAADYENMYQGFKQARATEKFSYARWLIEQEDIDAYLRNNLKLTRGKFLDFACGTGRWISYLEGRFRESVGIDVSEEMLKIAKTKCKRTRFICNDITTSHCLDDEKFSVVTAFRFFLRAEDSLRRSVLNQLRRVVADDGVLIFNVHDSKRSMNWPLYFLSSLIGKESPISGAYALKRRPSISDEDTSRLLNDEGFKIEKVTYLGIIPNYVYALPFASAALFRIDRFLYRKQWFKSIAIERIYFCTKK